MQEFEKRFKLEKFAVFGLLRKKNFASNQSNHWLPNPNVPTEENLSVGECCERNPVFSFGQNFKCIKVKTNDNFAFAVYDESNARNSRKNELKFF